MSCRGDRHWTADTFDRDNRITAKEPIGINVVVQMEQDTGKILRQFGAGVLYLPHMITIDRDGNIWVVDVGLHQVIKFSAEGKVLMEVGQKLSPGSGKGQFCKPTQVSMLRDGSFYVSDGYCNSRIVRYNAAGEEQAAIHVPDTIVSHSVLVDDCRDLVLVASRENGKVHSVTMSTGRLDGTVDVSQYGRAWALIAGPYGQPFVLAWEQGKPAKLVDIAFPERSWELPGQEQFFPHDIALGAAAMGLSGAGERMFALYVAPTCPGCPSLQKFVLVPGQYELPSKEEMVHDAPGAAPAAGNGSTAAAPDSHAHSHDDDDDDHHHDHEHEHEHEHEAAAPSNASAATSSQPSPTQSTTKAASPAAPAAAVSHSDHAHHEHTHSTASADEYGTIVTDHVNSSFGSGISVFVVLVVMILVVAGVLSGYYYVQHVKPKQHKYVALTTLPVSTGSPRC